MIATLLRIFWINLRRDRFVWLLTFAVPIAFFSIFAIIFILVITSTLEITDMGPIFAIDSLKLPFSLVSIGSFLFIALGRVGDDEVVSRFSSYLFNTREYGSNEVAVQFMHYNTNGICFLFAQATGESVMPVTQFPCRLLDLFPCIFINGRIIL